MRFSLNSTTVNQYLVILSFFSQGVFHIFLIWSAFRCWDSISLVGKPLSGGCIECSCHTCEPSPRGLIHLRLFSSIPLVFDLDFSISAAEDAICLLRDTHSAGCGFFLSTLLCFEKYHFIVTRRNCLLEEPNFLWKTLGFSVNIAKLFLNRALLSWRTPQEGVIRLLYWVSSRRSVSIPLHPGLPA